MAGLEKRRQKIYKGGRTYTRTVTNIKPQVGVMKLKGVVMIGRTRYIVWHYGGDIWTASGAHYREQQRGEL